MRIVGVFIFLFAFSPLAHAWMDSYAPKLKSTPAKLTRLSTFDPKFDFFHVVN